MHDVALTSRRRQAAAASEQADAIARLLRNGEPVIAPTESSKGAARDGLGPPEHSSTTLEAGAAAPPAEPVANSSVGFSDLENATRRKKQKELMARGAPTYKQWLLSKLGKNLAPRGHSGRPTSAPVRVSSC